MSDTRKRTDPLWLRVIVAIVLSGVFWVLALMMIWDLLGVVSLYLCAGGAVLTTVLMAWKGRRVGQIATWFFEMLAGI